MGAPADAVGAPDCAGHAGPVPACPASDFEAALASDPANWTVPVEPGLGRAPAGRPPGRRQHLGQAIVLKPSISSLRSTTSGSSRRYVAPRRPPCHDCGSPPGSTRRTTWRPGTWACSSRARGRRAWSTGRRGFGRRRGATRTCARSRSAISTDERIYRVSAEAAQPLTLGSTNAPAAGAVAFATVATVGGLVQLLGSLGGRPGRGCGRARGGHRDAAAAHRAWPPIADAVVRHRPAHRTSLESRCSGILAPPRWNVLGTATDAPWATFLLAAVAVLAGIACHMLGHLAVSVGRVAVRPAARWPDFVLAVVALPFQVPVGPFPAERVAGTDRERAWRITLAALVAAVIAAAAVAYAGFVVAGVPFLRLLSPGRALGGGLRADAVRAARWSTTRRTYGRPRRPRPARGGLLGRVRARARLNGVVRCRSRTRQPCTGGDHERHR